MKSILFLNLLALPLQAAIIIDGFSADRNDRFANDPTFIAASKDLSGVGRLPAPLLGTTIRPWATMISSNVFVGASHTVPGGTITFFPGNDPSATPIVRNVIATMIVGGSDITIGCLDFDVPASIAIYPYETETISTITGAFVEGLNAYTSGASPSIGATYGVINSTTTQSVGRNIVDGFEAGVLIAGLPTDLLLAQQNIPGDLLPQPYTVFETLQQSGDSGAPLFIDNGVGGLKLIGIASAIGTIGSGADERNVSAYAYIGNYSDEIDDFIAIHTVPEPGTAGFLILSVILLQRCR